MSPDRDITILVVEDEEDLATLLRYNFEKEGYRVHSTANGDEALLLAREQKPDMILLDWMLPGRSGLEICRMLRHSEDTKHIPILMLTARGEEEDRVRGLENGADDYVVKPFSMKELLARQKALLRRARGGKEEILRFGDITMDLGAHMVERAGVQIHLGPTEYRLLRYFLDHPRRVFSREQLLDQVWGYNVYVEQRTVDVHIRRLRKALDIPGTYDVIRTVRSAGYALDDSHIRPLRA